MRKRARIIFTIVHLGTTDGKATVATSSERGNDALRSKVISIEKGRDGEENKQTNKQTTTKKYKTTDSSGHRTKQFSAELG